MRYYKIVILPLNLPSSPIVYTSVVDSSGMSQQSNTSATNVYNPGALEVDIDIPQYHFAKDNSYPRIRIKGVSYADISQISNFNGASIEISIGMSIGLPLANPYQAGVVLTGTVIQAFANWQGNQISLELVCVYQPDYPVGYNPTPVNLSFTWTKGLTLESIVRTTLGQAFPNAVITGTFSPLLVFTENQPGVYFSLLQFSLWVNQVSHQINSDVNYLGATITPTATGFVLYDGTPSTSGKVIQIDYTNIVGNLTWISYGIIQAKLVMRGDLNVSQLVTFPTSANIVNQVQSFSQYRNNISFPGTFQIYQLRHVGNSRQLDADSWVTVIDCAPQGAIVESIDE